MGFFCGEIFGSVKIAIVSDNNRMSIAVKVSPDSVVASGLTVILPTNGNSISSF